MYSKESLEEDYQKAVKEAMGENPNAAEKITQLRNQWQSARYQDIGEETSIMRSILVMKARPVHTAIIVDNLAYFKANYEPDYLELALVEACLCGSRNVAEYVLELLKTNYIERSKLLAYIAASPNFEWAKAVAVTMVTAKVAMPKDIYRLALGPVADKISEIFKTGKNKPSEASSSSNMLFKFAVEGDLPPPRGSAPVHEINARSVSDAPGHKGKGNREP